MTNGLPDKSKSEIKSHLSSNGYTIKYSKKNVKILTTYFN